MEAQQTETPQRRSSRRSGRQQYVKSATDDEIELEEQVKPEEVQPEVETSWADEKGKQNTPRRSSRRITVKLSTSKK